MWDVAVRIASSWFRNGKVKAYIKVFGEET